MTPEQREKELARVRAWRANWTPEQREEQLAKQRLRSNRLTPEQKEKKRANSKKWNASMTPEQKKKQLARQRRWRANLTPDHYDKTVRVSTVKKMLADQMGVLRKEVPVELLEAKVAILNVKRKVKELIK